MKDREENLPGETNLREVFLFVRRNLPVIISSIFITVVVVAALTFLMKPVYEAEVVALPPGIEGRSLSFPSAIGSKLFSLGAEVTPVTVSLAILNSRTLLEKVVEHFRLDTIYKVKKPHKAIEILRRNSSVGIESNTDVIVIKVQSHSPRLAAEISNYFVEAAEEINEEIGVFLEKPMLKVIDEAIPPKKRKKPKRAFNLVMGFFLGSILGVVVAAIRDHRDDRIYSARIVGKYFDLNSSMVLPKIWDKEIPFCNRSHISNEKVAVLLTEKGPRENPRIIVSASSGRGEGKTFLAVQLANAFREVGLRVLLIDMNPVNPFLSAHMAPSSNRGITDILNGVPPEEVIVRGREKLPLDFVPVGNLDEYSFFDFFKKLSKLREIFQSYDVVVIDTGPLLETHSSEAVLPYADLVFLVVMFSRTTRDDIRRSSEVLAEIPVRQCRVVLNCYNEKEHSLALS